MKDPKNPIAFNPDTMTLNQVKECADTLSRIFDAIGRGQPAEDIVFSLTQARDDMANRWAR